MSDRGFNDDARRRGEPEDVRSTPRPEDYPPPPPGTMGSTTRGGETSTTRAGSGQTTRTQDRTEQVGATRVEEERRYDDDREWREGVREERLVYETPGMERAAPLHQPPDRVRWGPIWAGVVVAIATFVLLQLALFATDAINLNIDPTGGTDASYEIWTALAAIVAFFLGGLTAGAAAKWRSLDDGALQGVVMWALAIVGLIIFSTLAVGNLAGALGLTTQQIADLPGQLQETAAADATLQDAQDVAAQAVLFLGLTVLAAVGGALAGAKLWPTRRHLAEQADAVGTERRTPARTR
jgi:cation transport ATPase